MDDMADMAEFLIDNEMNQYEDEFTTSHKEKSMTDFIPNVNKCFAFEKKTNAHPKAPDWSGTIRIETPGIYNVAIWRGYADKDHTYKGVSVKLSPPFNKNKSTTPPSVPTDSNGENLPF